MKAKRCAYCGKITENPQKEHVFPKCLYSPSKERSKIQRLTVFACANCNNSWSDDEAHFRNVLLLSGDPPNLPRQELWKGPVRRSFKKIDGEKRVRDLLQLIEPVQTEQGLRQIIYPAKDERVMRVVRKIVRGLCHYHKKMPPVSDIRVWTDVLRCAIPKTILTQMKYHHREEDIVEYWYLMLNDPLIHSAWLFLFYKSAKFIGLVSNKKNGFPNDFSLTP